MKVVALAFCIATPVLGENLIQRLERKETRAAHGRHLLKYDTNHDADHFYLAQDEIRKLMASGLVKTNGVAKFPGDTDGGRPMLRIPFAMLNQDKTSLLSLVTTIEGVCTDESAKAALCTRLRD